MGKPVRGYRFQFGQTLFAYVLDFENFPHTGFGDYLIVGIDGDILVFSQVCGLALWT